MRKILNASLCCATLLLAACSNSKTDTAATSETKDTTAAAATEPAKKPPMELLPPETYAFFDQSMNAFEKGDMDAFTANYADDAHLIFSGGDSLVGKKAIADYWKGRFSIIDSVTLTNRVFLAVRVNESPTGEPRPGTWILSWHRSHPTYKNKKSIWIGVQTTAHLNDAGKIDWAVQYIDRAPIMAVTKGLVIK